MGVSCCDSWNAGVLLGAVVGVCTKLLLERLLLFLLRFPKLKPADALLGGGVLPKGVAGGGVSMGAEKKPMFLQRFLSCMILVCKLKNILVAFCYYAVDVSLYL